MRHRAMLMLWSTLWQTSLQKWRQRLYATHGGDAQALFDTVAASLVELEAETQGDTLSDAHALVELLADTEAEVAP